MVLFDFDTVIERKNTASVKWEQVKQVFGEEDVLPMWVADMDFNPPHEVAEAIKKRVEHEILGYAFVPDSTAEAIQAWLKKRHNWDIPPAWIAYCTGIVPAISTAIQAFTEPGDKVLLMSPVYHPFFHMVEKNGRVVANAQLKLTENRFEIDWEQVEARLKEGAKLFLGCNPHNPGGRVWTKDELVKMADLCAQYGCLFLSDEIHSDLVYPPHVHVPVASLGDKYRDMTITCIAPTKTFNLAGIKASAVIIPNPELRKKFKDVQAVNGTSALNTFGIVGMEAAYRHGGEWLDALLVYLKENIDTAARFIAERLPEIRVMETEGTYLMWLDCRAYGLEEEALKDRLWKKAKLGVEIGSKFGPGGEGFIRMNIACPRKILMEGLNRLEKAFA
ncbi:MULTISPECIES: MalY/PatB family protein [Heyndrickxia]|uniref:MalY/PatB family protein n=1 Tax=Heyndrickxia TaxID=2837504 RepID=UPI000E4AD8E0|nr:MalY/PatB family protein [Heyndrickxia coagulans]RGR78028.1 pyridoxal phosphate-dependent aminotransferase [Heyndrickxia coagulans]RGR92817.1 pyridoxal phosphate-dependent aminotransferase [Heyndrickxia coagulans]